MIKRCPQCNGEFDTLTNSRVYCSHHCNVLFNNNKRKSGIKLCQTCSVELSGKGRSVYCSDKCRKPPKKQIRPRPRVKKNEPVPLPANCIECGVQIKHYKIFCSYDCAKKNSRKYLLPE